MIAHLDKLLDSGMPYARSVAFLAKAEIQRLRGLLDVAWFDYDDIPYEMATPEYERLERCPRTGLYKLDEQAICDAHGR